MNGDIARVVDGSLCAGCGLCASDSAGDISMHLDEAGYLRPVSGAPLEQELVGRIKSYCPGLRVEKSEVTAGAVDDPTWGPVLSIWTGHALDAQTRHVGASGGVVTALGKALLETGEVDLVVATRGVETAPFTNETSQVSEPADLITYAGSRYSPSAPLSDIKAILDLGRPIAFVGKPCDIVALRQFEALDPRVKDLVRVKLSFFCAGVPSVKGSALLASKMGLDADNIVEFRYRGQGWPGEAFGSDAEGRTSSMPYAEAWGQILNRTLQSRCKHCFDGTGEAADIACGDGWISDDGYPDFAEAPGRSVVVARTVSGAAILDRARQSGHIMLEASSLEDLARMQPHQGRRKAELLFRQLGRIAAGRPTTRYDWRALRRAARKIGLLAGLRVAAGAFVRARKE